MFIFQFLPQFYSPKSKIPHVSPLLSPFPDPTFLSLDWALISRDSLARAARGHARARSARSVTRRRPKGPPPCHAGVTNREWEFGESLDPLRGSDFHQTPTNHPASGRMDLRPPAGEPSPSGGGLSGRRPEDQPTKSA